MALRPSVRCPLWPALQTPTLGVLQVCVGIPGPDPCPCRPALNGELSCPGVSPGAGARGLWARLGFWALSSEQEAEAGDPGCLEMWRLHEAMGWGVGLFPGVLFVICPGVGKMVTRGRDVLCAHDGAGHGWVPTCTSGRGWLCWAPSGWRGLPTALAAFPIQVTVGDRNPWLQPWAQRDASHRLPGE